MEATPLLDHGKAELPELGERRRSPEEMDGKDRLGARTDSRSNVLVIEVHRSGVYLREDRRSAAAGDRLCGRIEGERRTDHLVAGADPERVHHEDECVGAVGDADGLLYAEILRRFAFEGGHVRPEDELAARQHALDRLAEPRQQGVVLRFYVNQRDRRHDPRV